MLISCTECATKHLSTAAVFIRESLNGYPDHALWAIGELVNAEYELLDKYPDLAYRVRAERLLWRENRKNIELYNIPFMELMKAVQERGDEIPDLSVEMPGEQIDQPTTFSVDPTVHVTTPPTPQIQFAAHGVTSLVFPKPGDAAVPAFTFPVEPNAQAVGDLRMALLKTQVELGKAEAVDQQLAPAGASPMMGRPGPEVVKAVANIIADELVRRSEQ